MVEMLLSIECCLRHSLFFHLLCLDPATTNANESASKTVRASDMAFVVLFIFILNYYS